MSMPVVRSLTNAMSRCSVISRRSLLPFHRRKPSILCTGATQTHRTLTRSLWHMSRSTSSDAQILTKPVNHQKPCSCGCGLHTQGNHIDLLVNSHRLKCQWSMHDGVDYIAGLVLHVLTHRHRK